MRLIDGDYLYNKLVANKCPYDLVLQMVKDEPTVCDIEQIRAEIELLSNANPSYWHSGDMVEREEVLEIIDKYRGGQMIDIESICENCDKKDGCQEYEQVRKAKELYIVKGCEWFIKKENRNERT